MSQPRVTWGALSPYEISKALRGGNMTGKLYHQLQATSAERERLASANAALARRVEVLEAIHQSDRATLREALEGRVQRWRLWMWDKPSLWQGIVIGAAIGMALMAVVTEIVRWIVG